MIHQKQHAQTHNDLADSRDQLPELRYRQHLAPGPMEYQAIQHHPSQPELPVNPLLWRLLAPHLSLLLLPNSIQFQAHPENRRMPDQNTVDRQALRWFRPAIHPAVLKGKYRLELRIVPAAIGIHAGEDPD